MAESQLSKFLRSRRDRLEPRDAGLVDMPRRRRVPGLRREDVAQLAGVSVDYYTRLEQGRSSNVSDSVLVAVAKALLLDPDEREYLVQITRAHAERHIVFPQADETARRLLRWISAPALVLNPRLDVLASNEPAELLLVEGDSAAAQRNLARIQLLGANSRERFPDQRVIAHEFAAHLRMMTSRFPFDDALTTLIDELYSHSASFRAEWESYPVRSISGGVTTIDHHRWGLLSLHYEVATVTPDLQHLLWIYTATPGSQEERTLRAYATSSPAADTPPSRLPGSR
ncbi:helix-turn-helix transcriptional regulator [Nocardia bhagyanarayanae]|uniref:Helix-turn-helix protein n=1 Tax=Nocardia bhagyanarayanae TaxID=1215925 RepID=A0A543FHZ0_9NOCA|nr:helix-turn-helix transcriptional regulator [Nocardia bhagyanarayanae]TQM33470.1 helix-turn-helix protein [Nocardia bhagyanarayanae]